jgi:hypothetical protein
LLRADPYRRQPDCETRPNFSLGSRCASPPNRLEYPRVFAAGKQRFYWSRFSLGPTFKIIDSAHCRVLLFEARYLA